MPLLQPKQVVDVPDLEDPAAFGYSQCVRVGPSRRPEGRLRTSSR